MKHLIGNPQQYWLYRVLALLWMAVLYWLSSKPSLPTPDLFWGQDKVEHAVAFGLLGFLFASSFRAGKKVSLRKRVIMVTFLVGVYGFFDEAHQFFVPGRDASFFDLCADAMGGFLSALLFLWYQSRKFSRQKFTHLS
jgi:VanZ family protein